jgi:hypothetical protein
MLMPEEYREMQIGCPFKLWRALKRNAQRKLAEIQAKSGVDDRRRMRVAPVIRPVILLIDLSMVR